MSFDLQGKVTLVTGASRGIGRGIALELAGAGCDLLLTARDKSGLEEVAAAVCTIGRRAEIHIADLRTDNEPGRIADLTKQTFGRLDILVNNAGAARRGNFFELTDADWFGQPEDVAGLVAFIVSPRGRWLHGAAIDMDGGQVEPLRMSRYD